MRFESVEKFISDFTADLSQGALSRQSVKKFPQILRKIVKEELPQRDKYAQVIIRDLENTQGLKCSLYSEDVCCYSKDGKYLLIGTVVPYWSSGLKDICKDEQIEDLISAFFHFASQYIARSKMLDIIGSIAFTYNRAGDYWGSMMHTINFDRSNKVELSEIFDKHGFAIPNDFGIRGRNRQFLQWNKVLNALDPYMNRMIFNYIKAMKLDQSNFSEEAVLSLNKTVDIAMQFITERLKVTINCRNKYETFQHIGLNKIECKDLERLYQLRCYFGAHPSMSKWWDFYEIYGDDINEYFFTVKKLILKIAFAENQNRVVEKNPVLWSEWFYSNAQMLWDANWFHRIPK